MASFKMADAVARVQVMLREEGDSTANALITPTNAESLIGMATRRYSVQRPRLQVIDLDGAGTPYIDLPDDWQEGLSSVVQVEYPIGAIPPEIVDKRTYDVYQTPDAYVLRFLYGPIVLDTQVRVTYTGIRVFATDAKDTTVLDIDYDAVCALAASRCADMIAAQFARTHEPVLHADVMDHGQSKSQAWQTVAKRWQAVWDEWVASVQVPATGIVNWDTQLAYDPEWSSTVGRDFLTHTRWGR